MSRLGLVLLLSLCALTLSEVIVLTDSSFEAETKTGKWFVEFYAPWCGHCKALSETWDQLSDALKDSDVKVAKVDATVEEKTAQRYEVEGYPTLKLVTEDRVYEYRGKRTLDALKEFAAGGYAEKSGVPRPGEAASSDVIELTDATFSSTVGSLKEGSSEVWFVEFFAPWCGACQSLTATWNKLGTAYKGHATVRIGKVDATTNKKLKERFTINGYPTLLLFANGRYYSFSGSRSYEDLEEFLSGGYKNKKSQPIPPEDATKASEDEQEPDSDVIVLKDSNFEEAVQMGFEDTWFVEFYAVWCGHCKSLKPTWDILATELKGKVKVGKIEANIHKDTSSRFAVAGFPTLVVIRNGLYYDYSGARMLADLKAFALGGYKNQTGAPISWKSSGKTSAVKQLDDSNFESLTQAATGATTGDWFVNFEAEWCKPCMALHPVWEYTAHKLVGQVNFGAIEGTTNPETAARFNVYHFPTQLLLSHGMIYKFNGTREVGTLLSFAQKAGPEFESAKPKRVPPVLTLSERLGVQLNYSLQEAYKLYKYNPIVAVLLVAVGGVISLIASYFAARYCGLGSQKEKAKKN